MHTIGKQFNRAFKTLVISVLIIAVAIPVYSTAALAAVIKDDEFNGSSLDTSIWTTVHKEGGVTIAVSGGALRMDIPADSTSYTFSNTNKRSPRILQPITDDDFSVEVKFTSPMNVYQDDKIQGILVRDKDNKWLRFDFNTDSDSLNTYIGYVGTDGLLRHIENVRFIDDSGSTLPLYLRVQYTKNSNQWIMSYRIGDAGDFIVKKVFSEPSALENGDPITFAPSYIGLFAGSTGTDLPGHVMTADYFKTVGAVEPPPPLDNKLYLPTILR